MTPDNTTVVTDRKSAPVDVPGPPSAARRTSRESHVEQSPKTQCFSKEKVNSRRASGAITGAPLTLLPF